MSKYRLTNRKDQPYPDAQILGIEAIANELAEMNRLKRLELKLLLTRQGAADLNDKDLEDKA